MSIELNVSEADKFFELKTGVEAVQIRVDALIKTTKKQLPYNPRFGLSDFLFKVLKNEDFGEVTEKLKIIGLEISDVEVSGKSLNIIAVGRDI